MAKILIIEDEVELVKVLRSYLEQSGHLAVAHGGWLEAANSPQGGAVFTLTLPKAQPASRLKLRG